MGRTTTNYNKSHFENSKNIYSDFYQILRIRLHFGLFPILQKKQNDIIQMIDKHDCIQANPFHINRIPNDVCGLPYKKIQCASNFVHGFNDEYCLAFPTAMSTNIHYCRLNKLFRVKMRIRWDEMSTEILCRKHSLTNLTNNCTW